MYFMTIYQKNWVLIGSRSVLSETRQSLTVLCLKNEMGNVLNTAKYCPVSVPWVAKVHTIFWESNASYGSLMSWEVGHVDSFLQIPNLDHRVLCTSAKDQTVRVKLCTGQCWKSKWEIWWWRNSFSRTQRSFMFIKVIKILKYIHVPVFPKTHTRVLHSPKSKIIMILPPYFCAYPLPPILCNCFIFFMLGVPSPLLKPLDITCRGNTNVLLNSSTISH